MYDTRSDLVLSVNGQLIN